MSSAKLEKISSIEIGTTFFFLGKYIGFLQIGISKQQNVSRSLYQLIEANIRGT
jgi:hypothetical protein